MSMEETDRATSSSAVSTVAGGVYDVDAHHHHDHSIQKIWSWGAGTDGQLGTGESHDSHTPQLIHHLFPAPRRHISHISCGGAHVIALTSCGRVLSWGRGTSGQLGHRDAMNRDRPVAVEALEGVVVSGVAAGWNHSGFVSASGQLFTCGDGSFGQLGHGDLQQYRSPLEVSFFDSLHVEQIACGMRHSLVLVKDDSVTKLYGFGYGKRGQLGVSKETTKFYAIPQLCLGLQGAKIVTVIANGDHSAALTADGQLYTWGRGYSGKTSDASLPCQLKSSLSFKQAALGWNHALLLTDEGDVFMLGGYRHEMLGEANSAESVEQDLVKVSEIGEVRTWGWGEHGQLGLGDTRDRSHPQVVDLGEDGIADSQDTTMLYCGSGFTIAVRTANVGLEPFLYIF
ncbi:Ultraviolet-B receptor UVR8-like protein [Drosera capensis]